MRIHTASLLVWPSLLHLLISVLLLFSSSRNGTQLQVVCKDFSYDFNLQESRDLPHPVVIKPVGCWRGITAGARGSTKRL